MVKQTKIIRLKDGEDIMSSFIEMPNHMLILENPMSLFFKRLSVSKSMVMMSPWLPIELIQENVVEIYKHEVLTFVEPKESLIEYYNNAVKEANEITGRHSAYIPSLNMPFNQVIDAAHTAKELGAGGLLVLPGITGFDSLRVIAEDDTLALPILGHPAMLGSLVISKEIGIAHGIVFGTLMRLAGADISIFPNIGGRFSFTSEQCLEIADLSRQKLGSLNPITIAPAGGMTLERIPEMIDMYGKDTALLIGGALSRGHLADNAARMCEMVRSY
jgi:ribulose-bisphosphate carboxylase large chain